MGKKKPIYDPEEFDEVEEGPSRSQLKRESTALQNLGLALAALGNNVIKESGLPADVEAALLLLNSVTKHEARRRHLQYIGKLMRTFDTTKVQEIVEAAEKGYSIKTADFHRIEVMREQLIDGDDDLLQELFDNNPEDGQRLRQLVLGARREKATEKPPKNARALFKLLRALLVDGKK